MTNLGTRICIAVLTFAISAGPVLAQAPQQTTNPPANPPAAAPQDKQPETMPLPKPGEVLPNNDAGQDNTQQQQKPDAELPDAPSSSQGQQQPQQPTVTPVPVDNTTNNPAADEAQPATQTGELPQSDASSTAKQPKTTNNQQPLGTAAAEGAKTYGGGASRPAGVAIAPAKQKQSRSFLIRMGAIMAGAAALGTVYALTKKTGPTPPNAIR
jgi:hypothetical protein